MRAAIQFAMGLSWLAVAGIMCSMLREFKTYRVKQTTYVQELSSEIESARNHCQIAMCNMDLCGAPRGIARAYARRNILKTDASEGIREIEGVLCQLSLGKAHCCLERYDDNATFVRNIGDETNVGCHSCRDVRTVAGPVTLYVMRHAEGCHNMKARALRSHTHKMFGKRDAPLTDLGMIQAAGARPTFVSLSAAPGFDAANWRVLVSPMRRAQQSMSIALGNTPFASIQAQVTPYANERSGFSWINPENTPTDPAVQKCLMKLDNPNPFPGPHSWHKVARCPRYHMSSPTTGEVQIQTCTEGDEEYSSASKKTSPQRFVDFVVAHYGGKGRATNIILTGHSNWAHDAGLTTDTLDIEANGPVFDRQGNHKQTKINWASVHRINLVPGNKVQQDMANAELLYHGTARSAGTTGFIEDDRRCNADIAWQKECSGGLWYWRTATAALAALNGV